jgi:pilus assembly protein Flp/PilA
MKTVVDFIKNRSGATAIEYGLIASLIAVSLILGLGGFADSLLAIFNQISDVISGAGAP